ncbi:hypothetical protein DSQ19_05010 [Candidatus Nitrosotenuis sp. DW1]|nr:hypothetical protein DSQ19_05010 [Candidatus Nitrosotenuis sp. DW1]
MPIPSIDPDRIKTEIDNYKYVCYSIVAFEKIFTQTISAKTNQGKKLKTSPNNVISPSETITPDLVMEVNAKNHDGYRATNEIKAWLPNDKKRWVDVVEQLKKYDDDLDEWEFLSNKKHDIMFTTDPVFTSDFKKYIEQPNIDNKLKIDRNFAIMESMLKERAINTIFIRKFSGALTDKKLDETLTSGISLPLYNILEDIEKLKFYDSKPPDIYMMMIMWDLIFPKFVNSRQKQRDLADNKTVELTITVEQIQERLSKFAPESNQNCIEKSWIRSALGGFENMKIAEESKMNIEESTDESQANAEKFTIKYRKHTEKTLEWLLKKTQKSEPPETVSKSDESLDHFLKNNEDKDNSA